LAVRFADPHAVPFAQHEAAVVEHEALGSLTLLAELPTDSIRSHPDVRALDQLCTVTGGELDLAILEAFCHAKSIRAAATALYLHHSSTAAHLLRIEQALGWRLDNPDGRFRASVALLARRLAKTVATS
jgi:hypothetical protein